MGYWSLVEKAARATGWESLTRKLAERSGPIGSFLFFLQSVNFHVDIFKSKGGEGSADSQKIRQNGDQKTDLHQRFVWRTPAFRALFRV